MALQILQSPNTIQGAQSPIIFSVVDSSGWYTSSLEYMYTAKVWIWTGSYDTSGSSLYTMRKFPNTQGSGIFDVSRLIDSKLRNNIVEWPSDLAYYKVEFGRQWASGSALVSESLTTWTGSDGNPMLSYDGYDVFDNTINRDITQQCQYWPFMTDLPVTKQYVMKSDLGRQGVFSATTSSLNIEFSASYINSSASWTTFYSNTDYPLTSSALVTRVPIGPSEPDFPADPTLLSSYRWIINGIEYNFEVKDECKWTPVRIMWKNRYGQPDWFNFYKKSTKSFKTDQKVYQPQLGSWESSTLSYNTYQARNKRYIVDTTENIIVNTDFLDESWNELFKQMLVSDEMYIVDANGYTPATIVTSNVVFKTSVNDKLIQYTFELEIGAPFKLLI